MRVRDVAALGMVVIVAALAGGCQQSIFRQYEYEEEIYLKLDGRATMVVNASIPALVALRGMALDPDAQIDSDKVRAAFDSPAARVTGVGRSWRRNGRRFVQVRLDVEDIRRLGSAPAFSWSTYAFAEKDDHFEFRQTMGAPAHAGAAQATGQAPSQAPSQAPEANQTSGPGQAPESSQVPEPRQTQEPKQTLGHWDGSEIVAVRMHLPSRIEYHNATSKKVDRGNIVSWEQPLRDRLAGQPLEMDVRMQTQSILYRTLTIFGLALVAAIAAFAGVVFWVRQKGRAAEA
jgi:hypothetical protein